MRGFAIAGFVVTACVVAGACSSSSGPSEFATDDQDARIIGPSGCLCPALDAAPICGFDLGSGGSLDAPKGACGGIGSSCTTTGPGICHDSSEPWTCTCETAGWDCINPLIGGGSCDAGTRPDLDASDASDDASDADAF